ncbi:MAG TPA: prephenate dehydrogenase [Firmicutes bacterium]|nr:prephenate dehydrogenase [Bacillota bacterium]
MDIKDKNILIVGLGVVGGSYAMALTAAGYKNVYAVNRSEASLKKAVQAGIVKGGSVNIEDFAAKADIAVIAVYPTGAEECARKLGALMKKGSLVTDVLGIKRYYSEKISAVLPDYIDYVPAHPMAGREKRGLDYASADVLKGANFIITPITRSTPGGIDAVKTLACDMGFGKIRTLTPEEHDRVIAYTSQLPHALAVSLINSDEEDSGTGDFIGDSFRDLTRIAEINADLWQELFIGNGENLIAAIDMFTAQLSAIRKAVEEKDRESLVKQFEKSSARRHSLIKK